MAAQKKSTRTTKTTRTTKAPKAAKVGNLSVSVHLPGSVPQLKNYPDGSTISTVIEDFNLDGYEISCNGSMASNGYKLSAGDIIRVGVRTKVA